MRNIKLIFKREYISRVKNKSFIVMTLLAPLIFVGFYAAVVLVALNSGDSDNYTKIQYLDESHVLSDQVDGDTVSNFVFSKVDSKHQ